MLRCREGYYLQDLTSTPTETSCVVCHIGLTCGWNSTLSTAKLRDGYFRLAGTTKDVHLCDGDNQTSPCRGGASTYRCLPSNEGPMCRGCTRSSTYYDQAQGSCKDCPHAAGVIGMLVGAAAAAALALASLAWLHQTRSSRWMRLSRGVRKCWRTFRRASRSVGLVSKAKIAFSNLQVATVLTSTYQLHLPESYRRGIRIVSWTGVIDWASVALPNSCMFTTRARLILYTCVPLVAVVLVSVSSILLCYFQNGERMRSRAAIGNAVALGLMDALPFQLVIIFFFSAPTSAHIFQIQTCIGFGLDDAAYKLRYFLSSDTSIDCSSPQHGSLVSLMWVFVFLWPIGMTGDDGVCGRGAPVLPQAALGR